MKLIRLFAFSVTVPALLMSATMCSAGGDSPAASSAVAKEQAGSAQQVPAANVLIYAGDSTAFGDAESLSSILDSKKISYKAASSSDLNEMSLDDLAHFKLIIWPGGYAKEMSDSLKPETREKIREAVRNRGVSYLGFCAGSFIAVGAKPEDGKDPASGLAIIDDANGLNYFYPNGDKSMEDSAAMVNVAFGDGTKRDLVWWGGPFIPQSMGKSIAHYPDGSSAISQMQAGSGFVTLSGPHPEAPADWRAKNGLTDQDGLDLDIAGKLIDSAISKTPLKAF